MGNDGGRRQWWGLMEGEGVVCWASHFVHGPSVFMCSRFVRVWSSLSFERLWWTVLAGHSSCCLSGVVVSVGACCSWVGACCCPWVEGHPWGVIIIWGGGIVICGWGIAFHGWGSLLSVGSGARWLLWFEHCGLRVIVNVRMGGGHLCGWWAWCCNGLADHLHPLWHTRRTGGKTLAASDLVSPQPVRTG